MIDWEKIHELDRRACDEEILKITFDAYPESWLRVRTEAAITDSDLNTTINRLICDGEITVRQVCPAPWWREPAPWVLVLCSMTIGALLGVGVSAWWM